MTKFNIYLLLVFLLPSLLIPVSCDSSTETDPYHIAQPVDSLMSTVFPADAPGAIVIISRGDTILYNKAYGLARLDSVCPVTDRTLFNIASSTKTITAAAILKLQEQGKLSLNDRLLKYYPDLREDVFGEITLRHVLAHTSGIADLRPKTKEQWDEYLKTTASIFGDGPDYRIYGRETEFTRYLNRLDSLNFEPGTRFERQDPPYLLLAGVIERVTGEKFEAWMKKNIFEPAGLQDVQYVNSAPVSGKMAHGYRRAEGQKVPRVFRSQDGRWDEYDYGEVDFFLTKSDRGLYISGRDFARWQDAMINGSVLSDSSAALFRLPIVKSDRLGEGCSLGINVYESPEGRLRLYHRSLRGGFQALEATYPGTEVSYLVLSNRNDWDSEAVAGEIERLLEERHLI